MVREVPLGQAQRLRVPAENLSIGSLRGPQPVFQRQLGAARRRQTRGRAPHLRRAAAADLLATLELRQDPATIGDIALGQPLKCPEPHHVEMGDDGARRQFALQRLATRLCGLEAVLRGADLTGGGTEIVDRLAQLEAGAEPVSRKAR